MCEPQLVVFLERLRRQVFALFPLAEIEQDAPLHEEILGVVFVRRQRSVDVGQRGLLVVELQMKYGAAVIGGRLLLRR